MSEERRMDNLEIKAAATDIRSELDRFLSSRSRQLPLVDTAAHKPNRRSDQRLKGVEKKMDRNQSKQPQSQVVFWLGFIAVLIVIILAQIQ